MRRNKTLADLRLAISKEYSMNFESINLIVQDLPESKYSHQNNSQTLEALDIKKYSHFLVKEFDIPSNHRDVSLLNSAKTDFNEKVYDILREIFETFSKGPKMTKDKLAKFTSKATDGVYCDENDDRIIALIREYGKGEDYLDIDGFINFYRDSALSSESKLNTV